MAPEELEKRMSTEGFNPDLFFKYGVVVEVGEKTIYPYYDDTLVHSKKAPHNFNHLSPSEVLVTFAKMKFLLDKHRRSSGIHPKDFDIMTIQKILKECDEWEV